MSINFIFVAQHPALDFVNTHALHDGKALEFLPGFEELLGWLEASTLAEGSKIREARARWGNTPAAERVVSEARALRAHLQAAAVALEAPAPVPGISVDAINALLRRPIRIEKVVRRATVMPTLRGSDMPATLFTRAWTLELAHPVDLLVPIAQAGADLLCDEESGRVGRCAHTECMRFFLDTTKNRGRRWCETRTCGNRANVAAYHQRRREHLPTEERSSA